MFRTQYEPHERVRAHPGSPIHVLYQAELDDRGHIELVKAGEENIYDMIQSHRDSVDIHVLLKKFMAGDTEVLTRRQASFGDFTEMPSSYAELLNSVIAGQQFFEQLPVETRAKFGHSFHAWMSSIGTEDFAVKMGWQQEPVPAPVPSVEVKEVPVSES